MKYSLASLMLISAASLQAAPLPCGADLKGQITQLESAHYRLAFSSQPSPINTGEFFELDIALCPKTPGQPAGQLSIDAIMPKHQHGMNYQASITASSADRFHAKGLLFHMPGLWALHFDVAAQGNTPRERLTFQQDIE